MLKKVLLFLGLLSGLFASNLELQMLQSLQFEDAFKNPIQIPDGTKKVIVSFDKKGNAFMSKYLQTKPEGFLASKDAIYIGDIHQMPTIITYMFARPKMQEYKFMVYLYYDEDLREFIPSKQDHVSVLDFDKEGKLLKSRFIQKGPLAFE